MLADIHLTWGGYIEAVLGAATAILIMGGVWWRRRP